MKTTTEINGIEKRNCRIVFLLFFPFMFLSAENTEMFEENKNAIEI